MAKLHILSLMISMTCCFAHDLAKPYRSLVSDVICPDGRHACPNGSTCCKLPSGVWGCCPIPSAVCCNDHIHCCPRHTLCDVAHGRCLKGVVETVPWQEKLRARPLNSTEVRDIRCDGFSSCPDGTTCCKLASGSWGCCPMPSAVCCSDHVHCCPEGTSCDLTHGKCVKKAGFGLEDAFVAKVTLTETAKDSVKSVICPDQESYCPDGNTCCPSPSGQGYGCCPMPRANCCKDRLHCCPHDTICDLEHSTCRKAKLGSADELIPLVAKLPAKSVSSLTNPDKCLDKSTVCSNGHSCCVTVEATWGCCPPMP